MYQVSHNIDIIIIIIAIKKTTLLLWATYCVSIGSQVTRDMNNPTARGNMHTLRLRFLKAHNFEKKIVNYFLQEVFTSTVALLLKRTNVNFTG